MDRARQSLLWAIATIGFGSCALQLYLNMTGHPDHTPLWRLVDFLGYFTNTTAILATVVAILALARPASILAQPGAVTATAVYILVVAVTYEWLLRGPTHGLRVIANIGVHEALPALVILLWLLFTPKAGLCWSQPLTWVIYPAVYIAWILAHGAVTHSYPYFFADVNKLGYPRALINGAAFLLVFYLLGLGAVAFGRLPFLKGNNVPVPFRAETS